MSSAVLCVGRRYCGPLLSWAGICREGPNHFGMRLDFELPTGQVGHYSFRVGARPEGSYEVQEEDCSIASAVALGETHHDRVKGGIVRNSSLKFLPASIPDRLFLVAASGIAEFRPVYDALSLIKIYNLNPREVLHLS